MTTTTNDRDYKRSANKIAKRTLFVRHSPREENKQTIVDKSHEIQDEIAKHKSKSTTSLPVKKGKKKKKDDTTEVMVDVKAKLGGISVLVTSKQGGDITSILIGGMQMNNIFFVTCEFQVVTSFYLIF